METDEIQIKFRTDFLNHVEQTYGVDDPILVNPTSISESLNNKVSLAGDLKTSRLLVFKTHSPAVKSRGVGA